MDGIVHVDCHGSKSHFIAASAHAATTLPEVIVSDHPNFSPLVWMLARSMGSKSLVFIHGVDVWHRLATHRRMALRRTDRLVAVSEFTARKAARVNGFDANTVAVMHGCVDPDFKLCNPIGGFDRAPTLLTVARMGRGDFDKGHAIVIRALPRVLACFPSLTYHVVGNGDGRRSLQQLANELGVTASVRFHGDTTQADLEQLYAHSTIFVLPSQNEGFGLVFVEAMAHSLPVIGGNLDATPEVVANGETGILVDPRDPEAVSLAILGLLRDRRRASDLGAAGARRAREYFGYERFGNKLWTIIDDLAKSKVGGGSAE